jgi:alkylhydroperoxidase family enzyme
MSPRIPPLRRADAAPEVEAMFRLMDELGNPPPNMHLTFGRNPELYVSWLPFATHVIPASSLEHRHRQILILRCAYVWRSGYVWSQHVVMSKRFGVLVDDEISALAVDNQEGSWTPFEQALIGACDETRTHGEIADSVWAVLAEALSEVQLIDLVFTIGQYALISTALRSLRVELDEPLELPAWAPS